MEYIKICLEFIKIYLSPLKFLLLDINSSWVLRGNQRLYLLTDISLLVFSSSALGGSVF